MNVGSDLRKLLSPYLLHKRVLFRGIAVYLSWAVYPILNIILLTIIVKAIEQGNMMQFQWYLWMFVGVSLLIQVLVFSMRKRGWPEIGYVYQKYIQRDYLSRLIYLDNTGFEKIGTGKVVSIMDKGMSTWGILLSRILDNSISLLVTFLYVLRTLFSLGWWLFVGFIALLAVLSYISYRFNVFMLESRRKRVEAQNMYVKYLVKIIMSKVELMQGWDEETQMKPLDTELDRAIEGNLGMLPWLHWFFWGPTVILVILRIAVFVVVGYGIFNGVYSFADFIAIGAGLSLLDMVIERGLTFYKDATKMFDVVKRMREFFDTVPHMEGYETGDIFDYKGGSIDVTNVSFGYEDQSLLFDEFSLSVAPGKKTALIGASGVGKSTLVKLMAGHIRPTSGAILIDGQDLAHVALKTYFPYVGYLTQEPQIFDGTVRENLEFAMGTADAETLDQDERMKEALTLAKCEFVYELPQGLDTEIGERGVRLSGGQKQRLAIAKMFLKNAEIIILDEPTAALDSFSEEAVTEAMHRLFQGRTVIIIAHRLQTVKGADDIVVLDSDELGHAYVRERGTHQELVDRQGYYAKMLEVQTRF